MNRRRSTRSHPAVLRVSSFRSSDVKPERAPDLRSLIPRKPRPYRPDLFRLGTYRTAQPPADQAGDLLYLVLPLPPSINHHYATVAGRRVLSAAGRRFKTMVGHEVLCALAARKSGGRPFAVQEGAALALDLRFYFASELRRDIDGGLKITQDAVCEALGVNDNRVAEVTLRKNKDAVTPRMEVSVRALTIGQ